MMRELSLSRLGLLGISQFVIQTNLRQDPEQRDEPAARKHSNNIETNKKNEQEAIIPSIALFGLLFFLS